jgi:hypothetical protein
MDDFSTNRHAETLAKVESVQPLPTRHPDLWFSDGNIALVTGGLYFNVHRGLLCRHSTPLADTIKALEADDKQARFVEGSIILELEDKPKDLLCFLLALYDGV